MTLTRAELIRRGVQVLGGHSGSITSGTAGAAVLDGLIEFSGEDDHFVHWHLFMPEAAAGDRERIVTRWDDSTGQAHFEKVRTDTTYTNETYILSPDYSLDEWYKAVNKSLRTTKRTYRYVQPSVADVTLYPALPLSPGVYDSYLTANVQLEGVDDIDSVVISMSPNMLHNEDFSLWSNGDSLAPDGWTLAGTGASVARASTGIRSPYAATVTRASADATLYQDCPLALVQHLTRSTNAALPILSFGAWVTSSSATLARVGVYNGSSTTWSSYHTGTGIPEFLESTYQTTATDSTLRLVMQVANSAAAATFHAGILAHSTSLPVQLRDIGSWAYEEYVPMFMRRNLGGLSSVELGSRPGIGQLITYVRIPFIGMTADTSEIDDQYADAVVAGAIRWLTDSHKPNQDRTRIDRIRNEQAAIWTRANAKFISKPVQPPPAQVRVGGA